MALDLFNTLEWGGGGAQDTENKLGGFLCQSSDIMISDKYFIKTNIPAQLNRISILTKSSASLSIASLSVTSNLRVSIPGTSFSSDNLSSFTSVAMTRAPSLANSIAVARPMPCAAAVRIAILPDKRPFVVTSFGGNVAIFDYVIYTARIKIRD